MTNINFAFSSQFNSNIGTNSLYLTGIFWGKLKVSKSETYTFNALVDNGAKILINQVIKVDSMNGAPRWLTFSQSLVSNEYIDLIVYFLNAGGPYYLNLYWSSSSTPSQVIPSNSYYQTNLVGSSITQISVTCPTGYSSNQPSYTNICHEIWGDGIRAGSEQCDDGNLINGDGWSSTCAIQSGFVWSGGSIYVNDIWVEWTTGFYPSTDQSQCITHCGDSSRAGSEAWDDGNTSDGDGWSSTWTIETGALWYGGSITSKDIWAFCQAGYHQNTTAPTQWIIICGDGLRAGSEKCDDGNISSGDGCLSDCSSVESGYVWSGGSPTSKDTCTKWDKGFYQNDATNPTQWVPKWGDGIRVSYEHWDDGNAVSGDGWSTDCLTIETGWVWFGGYSGITDVWVQCDLGYDPNPDYSKCIGASVPRDVNAMAAAAQIGAFMGIASNLVLIAFSSSSSSSSNSFGMLNQIQLVILLPLIGAYIPVKIYDYLKSMNTSLLNLNFLPTNNSDSTISIKSLFDFKQPNSYLYLLQLDSGSALVNILSLTTTVGIVIAAHISLFILFAILKKLNRLAKLQNFILKLIGMLTFGFYIGVCLESFILFLLVDISEIYYQNKYGVQNISSTVASYVIVVFILSFIFLTFWQWWKSRKPEVLETMKYFVALVEGMKTAWVCRTYWFVFLIRRTVFIWIIFLMEDLQMIVRIALFVSVQAIYFAYILILRPQDSVKENFSDFINEAFYLYFVVFLLHFNTEGRWNDTLTDVYFWILMSNNFIMIFIMLGNLK